MDHVCKKTSKLQLLPLKSTKAKKGYAKFKKIPKFGAGAIFKYFKKILKAKKLPTQRPTDDYNEKSNLRIMTYQQHV